MEAMTRFKQKLCGRPVAGHEEADYKEVLAKFKQKFSGRPIGGHEEAVYQDHCC